MAAAIKLLVGDPICMVEKLGEVVAELEAEEVAEETEEEGGVGAEEVG